MTREITTQVAGDSVTATLPREMLDRLNVKPGERMLAVETEAGILLTPLSDNHEQVMAAFERGSDRYHDALRELSGCNPSLEEGMRAYDVVKRKYGNALRDLAGE